MIRKRITKYLAEQFLKSLKDLFSAIHAGPVFNEIVGRESKLETLLKRSFYQGGGKI